MNVNLEPSRDAPGTRAPRQERSRQTRARILATATRLFVQQGFAATTMAAIASGAGFSVQSLYVRFGGKLEILTAAFETAVVGDDEPAPLLERAWAVQMDQAVEARRALDIFMDEMCRLMQRTYPLYAVVRAAEPETAGLLAENKRQRYEGLSQVASTLASKRPLRARVSLEEAADRLYGLVSEDSYGLLVAERGWEPDRWRQWCTELVWVDLFGGRPRPPGPS